MKGYKVFNPDWSCNGFQYKVGETFNHNGEIGICKAGFHFCKKITDCFRYYSFDSKNKIAEIEALGTIITDGNKSVTDVIKIVREISWHEVLELSNMGSNCTGHHNTGDNNSGNYNTGEKNSGLCNTGYSNSGNYNSGYCNSGDLNSGGRNTGDRNTGENNTGNYNSGENNTGNRNTGNYNTGHDNSGSYNSGYCKSGDCNSGNYNSGNFNSCDHSNGFFNSLSPPLYAFNKPLSISRQEFLSCFGVRILALKFKNTKWIDVADMTEEEKISHPEYETTRGYLKTL